MKLIESVGRAAGNNSLQKIIEQMKKLLSFGKTDETAEDAILTHFLRGLDNRFVMLHNLPTGDANQTFPPILVGPPGVVVLNISSIQGFFRAREDSWWEMNKTTHRYNPGRPNLIKQSQEYAQKLATVLEKRQKSHPGIVPVLVFANPGVSIESTNPAIRIVLMDGVDNLISALQNSEEVLDLHAISALSDSLEVMGNPEKAIPIGEGEDFFGRDLLEPKKETSINLPKLKLPTSFSLASVDEKLKFTPKQWLILEILMILLIVILIAGIIYVLFAY